MHHGVRIHAYADDLQTYVSCKAVNQNAAICQIQACITELDAGTLARPRTRQTMSFRVWWRDVLPSLRLQARPWVPSGPTLAPHRHWWGSQSLAPKRSPTATLTASLSRRKPQDGMGSAWSQSPLREADTARRRAWWCLSGRLVFRLAKSAAMEGLSRSCCLEDNEPTGGRAPDWPWAVVHWTNTLSKVESIEASPRGGARQFL